VAHYIQLLTLTPEGRTAILQDPESVLRAQNVVMAPEITVLGLYAVLGTYDFVSIVEAPDNDTVARYSLEFGVRAGLHVVTLPAVPMAQFEQSMPPEGVPVEETGTGIPMNPDDLLRPHQR